MFFWFFFFWTQINEHVMFHLTTLGFSLIWFSPKTTHNVFSSIPVTPRIPNARYPSFPDGLMSGVRRSGVSRSEIFISTKVPTSTMGFEATSRLLERLKDEMPGNYADLCMATWIDYFWANFFGGTGKKTWTHVILNIFWKPEFWIWNPDSQKHSMVRCTGRARPPRYPQAWRIRCCGWPWNAWAPGRRWRRPTTGAFAGPWGSATTWKNTWRTVRCCMLCCPTKTVTAGHFSGKMVESWM